MNRCVRNIVYSPLWLGLHLLALLPFRVLFIISDLLCFVTADIVRYRRRLVEDNIRSSFPEKTEKEISKITKGFYRHFTDTFVETIKLLHGKGLTIAIASSRSRQSLTAFLKDMQLESYVSVVVASNDVEHGKPAPDMILKILETTGCKAEEAIMVGDTAFDIAMGRSAGTQTCAVTYGNGKPDELALADHRIDDFAKLADIVGQ